MIFNDGSNGDTAEVEFNFPCFTTHPRSVQTFYDLSDSQMKAYVDLWRRHMQDAAESFQADIIHAHHIWVTSFVANELDIPYVISVHGTDLMGYRKGPRYREMAQAGADGASGLIAISRQVFADTQSTFGLPEDKIHLIWNGFDTEIFKVLPGIKKSTVLDEFGVSQSDDQPLVSFVGKFTDFKGIDVLLRAAAIYENELPNVQTVLVGHGQLWDEMHLLHDELGLQGVHFLGHQSQPIVARIYNAADVSVVPSRIEPFGLVAVEALACGTPVVATNMGGLPDFINNDVGALVPVDDPQALAQAILLEIFNGTKESKGRYASRYALDGFSWSQQVGKMVQLYESALKL
jgi:glycosyltransferase involved in cell wall biosynthesis